jgi:hypothetical protein
MEFVARNAPDSAGITASEALTGEVFGQARHVQQRRDR